MERKPIAMCAVKNDHVVVVCDDGSVFVCDPGNDSWVDIEPIPGTQAALET